MLLHFLRSKDSTCLSLDNQDPVWLRDWEAGWELASRLPVRDEDVNVKM